HPGWSGPSCPPARPGCEAHAPSGLFVAIDPLAPLMTLLRLDRERRDRPRIETLQADRLAGLLAIAVGAILDALQRVVDLADELALTIARAQLDRTVGLRRRAVGIIGMVVAFRLQGLERLAAL